MPNDRVLVMLDMVEDLLARIRVEMGVAGVNQPGMYQGAIGASPGAGYVLPNILDRTALERIQAEVNAALDTDNPDSAYMEDLTRAASTVTTKPVPTTETQPPAPTFTPRPDLLVPFAGGGRSPGGKPWSTNPDETDGEEVPDE